MQYKDLIIKKLDQEYIDSISALYDIDYHDANIDDTRTASVTNQLIDYILTQSVYKLNLSEEIQDYIIDRIYCNCLDSWFDMIVENVYDMNDWNEDEKNIVIDFLNL